MSDHHIYFVDKGSTSAPTGGTPSSTTANPTAPSQKTDGTVAPNPSDVTQFSDSKMVSLAKKTIGAIESPASSAISAVTQAVPYVAVALIAVATAEKVVSTAGQFASLQGDNSLSMGYANYSKMKSAILNPIEFGISYALQEQRIMAQNMTQSQLRDLAGDSSSNTFRKRGA